MQIVSYGDPWRDFEDQSQVISTQNPFIITPLVVTSNRLEIYSNM